MIIPLCVAPWEQTCALNEGAKYSEDIGFYIDDAQDYAPNFEHWFALVHRPSLRGQVLIPDMLPITSWEKNLRAILSEQQWDRVRRHVYSAAGFRCEVCSERGKLEAHEKWKLHNETQIQELEKIMAVCPLCHKAYHLGFAKSSGMLPAVKNKLMQLNGWTQQQVDCELKKAYFIWQQRCEWPWTLDIEYVYKNGLLYV